MYSGKPPVKTFEEWYPEYIKGMHYAVASSEFGLKEDSHKAIAGAGFEAGMQYGIYCMEKFHDGD